MSRQRNQNSHRGTLSHNSQKYKARKIKGRNVTQKYPSKEMSRLDDEIKSLDQTIETNRKLALNLAEKRDLLVQMSEKRSSTASKSTSPNFSVAEKGDYTVKEMIEAEAELEEANALLSYRKSLRERLRSRITTMKQAADVTWKAYKGRGKSRDLALALAKIAALEREVDDLHDVELTMMQREQLRVRRDARMNAAATIQNKELTLQLNEALDQLEAEREKNRSTIEENAKLKLKLESMEHELKLAHKSIIEETTAANVAKTEVSNLNRRLRIAEAELVASHTRVAEKEALAAHFKESLKITNEALDQEFLASKRLQKAVSPTHERYETLKLNNFLASSLRNREIENILRKERLNIIKDIEQTQELEKLRDYAGRTAGSPSSKLLKSDLAQGISLTLEDASLIRAKAKAMAAAAEERLKIEEELYQSRLRSSGNQI